MRIFAMVRAAVCAALLGVLLAASAQAQTAGVTVRLTGGTPSSFPLSSLFGLGPVCANLGTISLPQGYATVLPCNSSGQLITTGGGGGGGGDVTIVGPFGQALMAASVPVVIASNQSAVPISAASLPLPAGGATSANQGSQLTQETAVNTALGTQGDSACGTATGTCTLIQLQKYLNSQSTNPIPAGTNLIGNVGTVYPAGATAITASATGTTAATTATLSGTSGKSTYICGYSIRANATAAATGNATVTGTVTGTLNFTQWTAPAASGLGINEQIFQPCVTASAANTAIAVVSAAPGTGGVVSVSAWGFQL